MAFITETETELLLNNDINHSLDTIIEILQKQVNNLKTKLEEERQEHRSIYAKIKEENEYLKEQLNYKNNFI